MEYDEEELNNIVTTTELPITTQVPLLSMSSLLVNASATVISTAITAPDNSSSTIIHSNSNSSSSIFPALGNVRFWSSNGKICEMISQAIHDLTRDLDPVAVLLIIVALTIAIVGLIAIFCQCHMWRKSKRQRHFDTNSWLEYSLDREKLTAHGNNNHQQSQAKLQRQMENKKFICKLFQSSLLPPVPLHCSQMMGQKTSPMLSSMAHGGKTAPFSLNDSQLYLSGTPGKHCFTVDIDQCQLVQSFMKKETGKQYMDSKKKVKKDKERQEKVVLKGQKVKKSKAPKKPGEVASKGGRIMNHRVKSAARKSGTSDTLPFFAATTSSSLSSSSALSDRKTLLRSSNDTAGVPPAALQKEYETQTLELNLTGSDDDDSHTNVSIVSAEEKIYERILSNTSSSSGYPPRSGMAVVSSNGGGKALVTGRARAPPPPPPTTTNAAVSSSSSPPAKHVVGKPAVTSSSAYQPPSSNGRLRQLIPPCNISEAVARANHSRSMLANHQHHRQSQSTAKSPYYSQPSLTGTLAKNPLYSEISEHEESIIFSDGSHPATTNQSSPAATTAAASKATIGGFALENESRVYSAIQQRPMNHRQLTYSTFIKPPSPPFR